MQTKYAGIGFLRVNAKNSDAVQASHIAYFWDEKSYLGENDYFWGLFFLPDGRKHELSLANLKAIYPIADIRALAKSYINALNRFTVSKVFEHEFVLKVEPTLSPEIWQDIRKMQRRKPVLPPAMPVINNPKDHQKNRKALDFSDIHGDMSNVPTSKESDGFRHMKTTPEQFPLAGWESDHKFKGKNWRQIQESLRKRIPREKEAIKWLTVKVIQIRGRKRPNFVFYGESDSRRYIIESHGSTKLAKMGQRFSIWYQHRGAWFDGGSHLSLFGAMQYCQDHLSIARDSREYIEITD